MPLDNLTGDLFAKKIVDADNLIVDASLKDEILKFYSRNDYFTLDYRNTKKSVMAKYRRQCAKHLVKEYDWPEYIANKTAKIVEIPSKNITIADYVLGYGVGSLPNRYAEPVAKLMGVKRQFYTGINILTDVFFLGLVAYGLYKSKPDEISLTDYVTTFNDGFWMGLTKLNLLLRTVQIPVRTAFFAFKKHTWAPTMIVSPNIVGAIVVSPLIWYDYKHKFIDFKKSLHKS